MYCPPPDVINPNVTERFARIGSYLESVRRYADVIEIDHLVPNRSRGLTSAVVPSELIGNRASRDIGDRSCFAYRDRVSPGSGIKQDLFGNGRQGPSQETITGIKGLRHQDGITDKEQMARGIMPLRVTLTYEAVLFSVERSELNAVIRITRVVVRDRKIDEMPSVRQKLRPAVAVVL